MNWKTIETAPKGFDPILVYVEVATVDIVRLAFFNDGELWEMQGFDNRDELRGWWTYDNSVSQIKLEGIMEPTHWCEYDPPT